jgi:hypothetical protein
VSLKVFHIFFVSISILLLVGFAGWCFAQSASGSVIVGALSISAAALLALYGYRFLNKLKRIEFR